MTARHSNVPNLTDFDLKLLRVFHSVVQCQGLAPAQQVLGLSLSTISIQLKQLEERLGFTLCERGRKGFALTGEGERIHQSLTPLFESVSEFRDVVAEVRGNLGGDLHFGLVDALSSNKSIPLADGFRQFADLAPDVHLHVDISSPQELLQGLIDGRYHCVVTPVEPEHESIESIPAFTEQQMLYCGDSHRLFADEDPEHVLGELESAAFTDKSYVSPHPLENASESTQGPMVSHMESAALLILSGRYVGHLPNHFAEQWVGEGKMRALLPDRLGFTTQFYLGTRRYCRSRSVRAFRDCMLSVLLPSKADTVGRNA